MLVSSSNYGLIWAALAFVTTVTIWRKIHVILTHPLRNFPGPVLCSISNLPYSYWFNSGRKDFAIHQLHQKYGPVVRIAPNELSFNTAQSWKDIYGFRPGHETFLKSEFYDGYSFIEEGVHGVITSRSPAKHAHMRRYLSYAFSDRALKEQEKLVTEIVDLFIRRVREVGIDQGQVMDFEQWLRYMTFDITGSLAFGTSFDALNNGGQHPNIKHIHQALRQMKIIDTTSRFPWAGKLFALFFARRLLKLLRGTKLLEQFSLNIVKQRLANPTPRPDFLTRLQNNPDRSITQPSEIQIACHISEILQAGADTSNTTLGTLLNFLLRDDQLYDRLCSEVRGKFKTYADIKAQDCAAIPCLRSIILEAMRIYPPVPLGLARLVPRSGDTVDGRFIPGGVTISTNAFSACVSESNFHDPWMFKPERWERNNAEKQRDILEASQPFSLGPRGCLGQNLAWMEMNTIICKLIWSFDLELVNKDMDLHRDSTMDSLWESPPLLIKIKERKN